MSRLAQGRGMGYQDKKEQFFVALRSGNLPLVQQMLIDDPMVAIGKVARDKSSLHVAAELGEHEMVVALLKAHPMLAREKDTDGKVPSAYAKNQQTRRLLKDAEGADWRAGATKPPNPTRSPRSR